MDIIALLTAFGLGSIVTAMVQSWLSNQQIMQKRSYDERKEAYVGLLDSYGKLAANHSNQLQKEFAYWEVRCGLVGASSVREAILTLKDTPSGGPDRQVALDRLTEAMRADLGVAR